MTWLYGFSTVILDDHAVVQTTFEMTLPSGVLLGWDLPRLKQNILKNFSHFDDRRARRKIRRLKPGSQGRGLLGWALRSNPQQLLRQRIRRPPVRLLSLCGLCRLLESRPVNSNGARYFEATRPSKDVLAKLIVAVPK